MVCADAQIPFAVNRKAYKVCVDIGVKKYDKYAEVLGIPTLVEIS